MATNELIEEGNEQQLLTDEEIKALKASGASAQVSSISPSLLRLLFSSLRKLIVVLFLTSSGYHRQADREAHCFPSQDRLQQGEVQKEEGEEVSSQPPSFLPSFLSSSDSRSSLFEQVRSKLPTSGSYGPQPALLPRRPSTFLRDEPERGHFRSAALVGQHPIRRTLPRCR